jgi:hypothetical protein
MRPTDARPDRRSVLLLGAGAGAALLTGCSLNNPFDSTKTPAAEAVRDLAPDTAAAVRAVVLIRTQQNAVTNAAAAFGSIAARLAGLRALHQAQLDALIAAVPKRVDTSEAGASLPVPAYRQSALLDVNAGELGLRDRLDNLALKAESGPFARLLGSMGAAISQHTEGMRALAGLHGFPPNGSPRLAAPAPGPAATPGSGSVDALQATLAGEHAAVYLYGVFGAQASQSRQPALYRRLLDAFHVHRSRRDHLTVVIAAAGADPVASEVTYDLPDAMATATELNDAALQVERRIARTYGQLIESTAGAERRWALVALDDSAVRQLEFRGTPEMFPGTS